MFYGRREQSDVDTLPALHRARTYPLLCLSLPHRWFPIGKTRSLCLRCGSTASTMGAPKRHRADVAAIRNVFKLWAR